MSTTSNIYKGFYITSEKNKQEIDLFFKSIQNHSEIYPLKAFWKRHCPVIELPCMPLHTRQELLYSLMQNKDLWCKFNEAVQREVIDHEEHTLVSFEVHNKINQGDTIIITKMYDNSEKIINLTPLKEFSYWLKLINILFLSIIRELLEDIKRVNTKVEKCILFKHIVELSIQSLPLISNKYAYNDLSFYCTQIEKIISSFDDGLEIALYAFGIMFPNLVNSEIHPVINKQSSTYDDPRLSVSINDHIFGAAKKKYFEFY